MIDGIFLIMITVVCFAAAILAFVLLVIGNSDGDEVGFGIIIVGVCGYMFYVMVRYDFISVPFEKYKCEKSRTLVEEVCVRQYVPVIPEKKGVE